MEGREVFGILRFNKLEYLESLLSGKLHMKLGSYYQQEIENIRKDNKDCISQLLQKDKITVKIGEHIINSDDLTSPVIIANSSDLNVKVMCCYAITNDLIDNGKLKYNSKIFEFGDYFIVFHNAIEFTNRIHKSLDKSSLIKWHLTGKLIQYKDFSIYHGNVGPFIKDKEYSYQNEWRFAIYHDDKSKAIDLDIGDISDIASIHKTCDIEKLTKITHLN